MKRVAVGIPAAIVLVCAGIRPGYSQAPTTITVTDKVIVEDCQRFGINLGGDAYYSGAVLVKKRVCENFEGSTYRQCHFGPLQDEHGATTWFNPPEGWREILIGGTYTILSGPAKGISGTIRDITTKKVEHQGKMKDFAYFVFDRDVPPGPPNVGLLVETHRLDEGHFRRMEKHEHWTTHNNKLEIGDPPPGSFGQAALNLDARERAARVRFSTHYHRYGALNGTWQVHFWARAKSGSPTLKVGFVRSEWGGSADVPLTPQWTRSELKLEARSVPEPNSPKDNPHLLVDFRAEGGEVLIDDVEAWLEGDENPTVFREDAIAMLKAYNPGCVRFLQMGGNTLRNTLMPPLRAHAFTSRRGDRVGPYQSRGRTPYSLHEMYELCEYIDAEPWYSLPGTLTYDELKAFMEYVGAPADVGYGKIRAELGHSPPWTKTLKRIHVEFGNEAWNNAGPYQCGGFNGVDYWKDLIEIGKSSPYFSDRIVFHAAGQAANSWLNRRIMKDVPNADRFGVAPYIIQAISKEQMAYHDSDDALFRWAFAWPLWRGRNENGAMFQNCDLARKNGLELSVYEVNHHITHGDGPLEPRNQIVTSLGGGLNVANTMLQMVKEGGVRTQALFSLVQHSYNAHNIGAVRLWGTALCLRKGQERYRPTFLACATANRVLGGDLLETRHSDSEPSFDASGVFSRRRGKESLTGLPCLFSYAFADGQRRGIVLVNLDTSKTHAVRLVVPGSTAGPARTWLLAADAITANKEFEQAEPQVRVVEGRLTDFPPPRGIDLPPHSLMAVAWETPR